MAVKKKTSSPSKPATPPKAAPKKSAPKKSAPKKTAPKKSTKPADAKSKPAGAPKGAVKKKAPAIKLSDAQGRVLSAVSQTSEAGYVGTKAEGRILDSLLKKKLIKKGKKEAGGAARYLVTKAGSKCVPAPVSASIPAPVPSAAPEASPSPAATA